MAQHESKSPSRTQEAEEVRRKKKALESVPEKLKAQIGEPNPFAAILESPMGEPSLEGHAALLGDARFSHPANVEQKARIVSQLQQNHGNAYVQRVVGRIQDKRDEEVKGLLGHELAHVVQQSGERPLSPTRITNPSEPVETQAEAVAQALPGGKDVSVVPRTEMAGAIARQPVEVKPDVVDIPSEAAPTKPPPATPAPPMTPAQKALKTLWLTAVNEPLCDAINVLVGKGSAQWKAKEAHKSLERSRTALLSVAESYKDTPQYDEMTKIHLVMKASAFALEPYFGARTPIEDIVRGLNVAADHVVLLKDKL